MTGSPFLKEVGSMADPETFSRPLVVDLPRVGPDGGPSMSAQRIGRVEPTMLDRSVCVLAPSAGVRLPLYAALIELNKFGGANEQVRCKVFGGRA
jgi:hypothetical protein